MIPWRGYLSFRVYSPDKYLKYGIRAYLLSDSTNCYVSKFKPYTRKSATGPGMNGATYDLMMNLMGGFFEKGYNLYYGIWNLFQLGVNATGTVRTNRRGIPQEIKTKSLTNWGDLAIMNNGPIGCIKFLDGKPVYMLSTVHGSDTYVSHAP